MVVDDVNSQQAERHAALLRRLSSVEKARLVGNLCDGGRQLAAAGVRHRYPEASAALVRWLVTEVIYGEPVATRLHGPRPPQ